MADSKIPKTEQGWRQVKKVRSSLERTKGNLPNSERVAAGPGLYHKNDVIVPGNRPKSRRYVGKLNQEAMDWRDRLFEAVVEACSGKESKKHERIEKMKAHHKDWKRAKEDYERHSGKK